VTALGSLPVGALVERLGPAWTARVAILLAADAMLAIALSARSMPALVLMLAVAATANSLGQLASNASLSRSIPRRRHGFAFGAKQAAVPLATLLSGAAVPALALTVGWRWGFVAGAALALAALALVPRDRPRPATARAPAVRRRGREPAGAGLVALSVGAALGAAATTTVATFLVDSAVAQGVTEALAGLMLTLGGVICVCARLFVGWLADRWNRGHLSMVAAMLAIGASGIALLGLRRPAASLLGVTLGYGLGWCWPGLLTFSVARLRPQTPAAVTSITQTGVYAGACLGPLGAGLLVVHGGYTVVWSVSACAMALSACFMLLGSELTVGTNGR
jgi:predicted MFS family arabinose efflux permease